MTVTYSLMMNDCAEGPNYVGPLTSPSVIPHVRVLVLPSAAVDVFCASDGVATLALAVLFSSSFQYS